MLFCLIAVIALLLVTQTIALFEVNLTSYGLSYAVNVTLGGQVLPMIVDTGNRGLTVLNINSSIDFDLSDPDAYYPLSQDGEVCMTLWEDQSYVHHHRIERTHA